MQLVLEQQGLELPVLGFLLGAGQWAGLSDLAHTTQCAQYASICQMGADWMWGWVCLFPPPPLCVVAGGMCFPSPHLLVYFPSFEPFICRVRWRTMGSNGLKLSKVKGKTRLDVRSSFITDGNDYGSMCPWEETEYLPLDSN